MKKINIMTIISFVNYGAILQCFSLNRKIKKLGYNPVEIKYNYNNNFIKSNKLLLLEKKHIKIFLRSIIVSFYNIIYYKSLKIKSKKVSEFFTNNIKWSKYDYNNLNNFYQNPLNCDVLIVGSDQVWNNVDNAKNEPFLLGFSDNEIKKISYGASIGNCELNEYQINLFKKNINRFDSISVRENTAKRLLSSLTDTQIDVVLDPVFLLTKEEWQLIQIDYKLDYKYILVYAVNSYSKKINKVINRLKTIYNLKIVLVLTEAFTRIRADVILRDVGPKEFLGLLDNAELVFTTSFHGTSFSIIYNKPFVSMIEKSKGSRIVDLLNLVGLQDQIIVSDKNFRDEIFEIDFTNVNNIVDSLKAQSEQFLTTALEINNDKAEN